VNDPTPKPIIPCFQICCRTSAIVCTFSLVNVSDGYNDDDDDDDDEDDEERDIFSEFCSLFDSQSQSDSSHGLRGAHNAKE
jgi:hypothetical protein